MVSRIKFSLYTADCTNSTALWNAESLFVLPEIQPVWVSSIDQLNRLKNYSLLTEPLKTKTNDHYLLELLMLAGHGILEFLKTKPYETI